MDTSAAFAIIGLVLAVIELWVPKLSSSLENWMTAVVRPLMNTARALKNTPARIAETLDGFTKKTLPGLLFAGLPALVIILLVSWLKPEWENSKVLLVPNLVFVVTLIPLLLSIAYRLFGGWVTYPIYAAAFVVAIPAWFIKLANKMGNGKGVSGIGLLLAFQGVLWP